MARQRKPAQSPVRSELTFRVGGLAPRIGWQHEGVLWSGAFRKLMTVMRDTGKRKKSPTQRDRIFHQRVAVRVRYSKRGRAGQWKAHGRYIQRESATEGKAGFDESTNTVKPSERLDRWQKEGDELLWKIIISPERGNELDMEQFTRNLLAQMDQDLGLRMEWTAVVHTNTDYHHVHLVIRGVDKDGKAVKLPRDYVKRGIRQRAEELATAKLGHRLEDDVILAHAKMVHQARFNDLDRAILRRTSEGAVYVNPALTTGIRQATEACYADRLAYLQSIGLAQQTAEHSWTVAPNSEKVLRTIADAARSPAYAGSVRRPRFGPRHAGPRDCLARSGQAGRAHPRPRPGRQPRPGVYADRGCQRGDPLYGASTRDRAAPRRGTPTTGLIRRHADALDS